MRVFRLHLFHLPIFLAAAALLQPLPAMAEPAAPTLRALVDNAWQRSPLARTLEARQDEAAAARDLSRSWLAAAPTLGLSDRSDRWTDQRNQRETEVTIAAPIVLPGQHAARQALAARGSEESASLVARARLTIAGEVRQRLWEAAAAREALAEKSDHLHHLEELRDEVQRRVKSGDLARSDGLLAEQEVLAAQADVALARMRAGEALARFRILTGSAELPALQPELLPDLLPEQPATEHVRLRAAQAGEQRARAALELAAASVNGAPTVALSMRRERDTNLAAADRSIGIAVQIPLGSRMRNRPAETLAATQVATAAAEKAEAQSVIESDILLAREQLEIARQALDLALARATTMREHTALFDKAFTLGERGLAELLRSRALTHEAEVAVRQQRIAVGLAHAQLNQAFGVLP
ncbi:TolC family protein [Pseudoduganella umbonata]|uniref:Outer membrane protein TolC n=1 Tax=Pseudoduganella umbonata TaxID=864828 RepID=A0A4V1ED49_9BURK|nr:TolC family protein [Pseudoduganella umbonata]MBB3219802.1 outer membrane protein TolC [Pseudoduganella umbonata]QCP09841.1 TolC family protein [Pseudoduganella umbonata]